MLFRRNGNATSFVTKPLYFDRQVIRSLPGSESKIIAATEKSRVFDGAVQKFRQEGIMRFKIMLGCETCRQSLRKGRIGIVLLIN